MDCRAPTIFNNVVLVLYLYGLFVRHNQQYVYCKDYNNYGMFLLGMAVDCRGPDNLHRVGAAAAACQEAATLRHLRRHVYRRPPDLHEFLLYIRLLHHRFRT